MKKVTLIKVAAAVLISAVLPVISVFASGFADTINNLVYSLEGVVDYANTNQKERFHQRMDEMPDEMRVILPFEVNGENRVFVSNDGSDLNDGSFEKPFKTVKRALKWVENIDASVRKKGMVIYLREGTYTVTDSLKMNGKHSGGYDAPLYISAYNNENVTFTSSNAIAIKDFVPVTDEEIKSRFYPEVREKIVEVSLKDYGITEYGTVFCQERDYQEQTTDPVLFCGEEQMTLARYPNNGVLRVGERVDDPAVHEAQPEGEKTFEWTMADDRAFNWKTLDETRVFAYFAYNYIPEYKKILALNKEKNTATVLGQFGTVNQRVFRTTAENTYYFYNVLEELDAEGEWYLDRKTGKLYIYPPSYSDENSIIYLSVKDNNIFEGSDIKNVVFNKIEFKNIVAAAINITYSDYIVVQNCKFINCSTGAVYLDCCTNSGVTTCYFLACPGNAVSMMQERYEDPYVYDLVPRNNFIQNNYIEGGKDKYSKFMSRGNGVVISHNLGVDSTHGHFGGDGINWYLEYNESVGGDKLQHDGAPYYTSGSVGDYIVARYNYLHHPSDLPMRGRGLYFDEGGSYFLAYGNIVHGGDYGSFAHNGKFGSWYNNIFLENRKAAATSANYFSNYKKHRERAFYTHETSWYCMANRHAIDPTVYNWIKIFPEHMEYFDNIYEYHDFLRSNPPNEMGEVEKWLLDANFFYLANNLHLGGGHEISLTARDTIIDENNFEVTKEDFADYDNGDFTVVNQKILDKMPGFEQIPMKKIGLIKDCDMWRDLKMGEFKTPMFPKSGYENRIAPADISFEWLKVSGASFYRLIIAEDENFENIVYDTVLGQPYAVVDLQPDKHYFYKIIAQSMAMCLDYEEVESEVYEFYTMTTDEANLVSKAEKKELRERLKFAKDLHDRIIEGTEPGQYPAGTKFDFLSYINNATAYMEETNVQGYIDDKLTELNRKIFDVQKTVKPGIVVPVDTNAANWEKVMSTEVAGGQDKAIKLENDAEGNLIMNTLMDRNVFIKNNQTIPYGAFATVKIKIDSLESWHMFAGIAFDGAFNGLSANNLYSLILSKDSAGEYSAEMQKYKREAGQTEFLTVPNDGIIKPGEWCDVAIGTIPTDEGTRFVVIVNDRLVYDYVDTFDNECYYTDSCFMSHRSSDTSQTEFAKSDLTYDEIMAIVNAAK